MSRYVAFFYPFFVLFYIYTSAVSPPGPRPLWTAPWGPLAVVPYEGRAEPEASQPREPGKPSAFTEPPLKKPKQASSVSAARPVDLPSMPRIFNRILGGKGKAAKIQQDKTPKTETKPVEPPSKNTKKASELLLLESMKFVPKQVAEVTGKKTTGKKAMKVKKVMKSMKKAPTKAMKKAPMTPKAMKAPMPEGMKAPMKAMKSPHEGDDNPHESHAEGSGGFEELEVFSLRSTACANWRCTLRSLNIRQMLPGGGFKSVISCCTKGVHADVCRQLVPHVEKGLCAPELYKIREGLLSNL